MLLNTRSKQIMVPPKAGRLWSSSAGPTVSSPCPGQIRASFGRLLVEFGQFEAKFGRYRARFGRFRAKFGRVRAMFGRFSAKLGRVWQSSGHVLSSPHRIGRNRPKTVEVNRNCADSGPNWLMVVAPAPNLDTPGPSPTAFDRSRPHFDKIHPGVG